MFKSKHKLDLGIVSFDSRGKEVLAFSEAEFASMGIYDIVHPDDLSYVASAHQECEHFLDTIHVPGGSRHQAAGWIIYRLFTLR
jgi:hypothetical protein